MPVTEHDRHTTIEGHPCVAVRARGTLTPIAGPTLTYVRIDDVTPEVARIEQRYANEQVRTMLKTGVCPCCGAER